MNIDDYKKINADGVETVTINGKDHYMKVNGILDGDLLALLQDKDCKQNDKMVRFLCEVICNKEGRRIFDADNEEHYQIIKTLPADVQTPLILKMEDIFFPKKKLEEVK